MSATGFLDACGFNPASSGTGDFVVSAAITGYQTPASAGAVNAAVYSYRAESNDKSQWEEGFGAYTVAGTTLARTTVTASSTGSKVSFSAAPNVFITAATADLQNAALLTGGTLPVGRINGGTANQEVQGDGTFQTRGRKLLNTLTASSSATLSDTTSITSTFSDYELVFENMLPATNNTTLELQVHTGGAFSALTYIWNAATLGSAFAQVNTTTFIQLSGAANVQNSGSGYSGVVRLFNPSKTTTRKGITNAGGHHDGSRVQNCIGNGYWDGGNGAIDGFQVLFSSGNIASGTIRIYGLA